MAEGDTIYRNARLLAEALAGEPLAAVEAPSPRSSLRRQPDRVRALAGRRLERADGRGKHLFLHFEGDLVLHCHQGMRGSWRVYEAGARWRKPRHAAWVVLTTPAVEAVEFDGTRLAIRTERELRVDPALLALGPDVLAPDFEIAAGVSALRERAGQDVQLGEALLDQRVICGIGNIYRAEACFAARVSPWRPLADLADAELERVVGEAAALMRAGLETGRLPGDVYRRAGQPCLRCGERVRSHGQGDANRTTYWCPRCQE